MHGMYSAYVCWNGKIAKQFAKQIVKITASMTQTKGSALKVNISNQALHALLRNTQCNQDMAAKKKLYKMVRLYYFTNIIIKTLFRSMI